MTRFFFTTLFSLSTLSALAAAPVGRSTNQPPEERARAVASELSSLRAPSPSFGRSMAGVGDLDGDGLADFAIGAPAEGKVYVYRGAGDVVALWTVIDGAPGRFGEALTGADTDGDGLSELFLGDPAQGEVLRYPGGADELGPPERIAQGRGMGAALAAREGLVLIGAPEASRSAGEVWAWEPGESPYRLALGAQAGDRLGESVAIVPDLDGDGLVERAAGAPGATALWIQRSTAETPNWVPAPLNGVAFGSGLLGLGDPDGDGLGELLAAGEGPAGGFVAMIGGADAPAPTGGVFGLPGAVTLAVVDATEAGAIFVVGGAGGQVELFHANGEANFSSMDRTVYRQDLPGFGAEVAGAGDLDGDGFGDLLVARCEESCEGVTVLRLGIDTDADGAVDEQDCDPTDASTHPGAAEVWADGVDQDCDGEDEPGRVRQVHRGGGRRDASVMTGERRDSAGCSVGGVPGGAWLGLAGLGLIRRKRR